MSIPPILTRQQTWLALILAGFVLLATIYSLVTPIFEASDELWHYPMVKYLADNGLSLPVQDPANPGPWRQEGSQPPLYYMIGAAATFWIDTSDLDTVRRINPHADIGVVVPDGNANMVVHNNKRESFPWDGTVLAVHIVRFLSILMGLGTITLAYALGRELFPAQPLIALAAAAFTAFNPMFIFVSAVINNDNLSTLLASLILLLIVRLLKLRDNAPTVRCYVLLGLAAGAGMLAKYQIGFLLPLIALALLIVSIRRRDWRPVIIGGLIAGGLTILIAGWWYWRNYDLYGDATGINVFLDMVGRRAVPADLHQLWTERDTFMMAFWGFFGGVNVPLSDSVYTLFNALAGLGVLGLLIGLVRWLTAPSTATTQRRDLLLARFFAALWPLIVFISLLSWTRQTWASQGRLWFSAITAINLWLSVGLANWSNRRWNARLNIGIACAAFVGVAALAPLTTIHPAYTLDQAAYWPDDTLEIPGERGVCFTEPGADNSALCAAYQRIDGDLLPGDYLKFTPTFIATGDMDRDWSIFVHLVNEDGLIEAQRDVYPGGGLLATSEIERYETWNNLIAVHLPEGLYTPQTLDVYLGLYYLPTGARMLPSGDSADPENARVYLGQIRLETPAGSVPNPVDVNFGGKLRLRGYEIGDRSVSPGAETNITLYWDALDDITTDYVISLQIIDPASLTKAAQDDRAPSPPTPDWRSGDPVTEARGLAIYPDAAPGAYRLMVRVYPAGDAEHPLRVVGDAGGQSEDFVLLSWIQVE
ncbi:MAG: glycosyltransferase family 39 protein [Anaerolineae bacterium]|nr:glycosyltransferase family 39 protein [Anaerolineae bacterium]